MGVAIGFAWMAECKKYRDRFGDSPPAWLEEIPIYQRVRFIRLCLKLGWRLPSKMLASKT